MFVVGLTGGIGSGKSTVTALFAKHHVPIIDADVVAHDLTQPNQPAFTQIVQHFGNKILLQDGTLNRSALRQLIFTDTTQRLWLEGLLHPLIQHDMEEQIKALSSPYCIAVVPLLFEVECYSFINRILVIDSPEKAQIARVVARDQVKPAQIEAILKTQAAREDRVARAHDVITNDGDMANLVPQVDKLHQMYLRISGEDKTQL